MNAQRTHVTNALAVVSRAVRVASKTGLMAVVIASVQGGAWANDVIRSTTPSGVHLRQVARVPLKAAKPGGRSALALAWSPDGRQLAMSVNWGDQISVLETSTWSEVSRIVGGDFQPERQLAFLSDTEIVTSPSANLVDSPSAMAVYDSGTGRLIRELPRPTAFATGLVTAIAVPSSRQYMAYIGGGIKQSTFLFETASDKFVGRLATPPDATTSVVAAGPANQLAVSVIFLGERAGAHVRKEIYLFDAATKAVSRVLAGHIPDVGSMAWSPDGRFIASGASKLTGSRGKWTRDADPIRIWDAERGVMALSFSGPYDPIYQLAWHPSKAVLATKSARNMDELGSAIRLWSIDRKEMIFEFRVPQSGSVNVLSFHPQTGHLVSAWGGELYVFEVWGL